MTTSLEERVIRAAEYAANGDPYKDVLDEFDIMELIEWAAEELRAQRRE